MRVWLPFQAFPVETLCPALACPLGAGGPTAAQPGTEASSADAPCQAGSCLHGAGLGSGSKQLWRCAICFSLLGEGWRSEPELLGCCRAHTSCAVHNAPEERSFAGAAVPCAGAGAAPCVRQGPAARSSSPSGKGFPSFFLVLNEANASLEAALLATCRCAGLGSAGSSQM